MARIPDATDFGGRPTPGVQRATRSDRSGEIIAGALVDAGEQLGRVSAEKQRKEDALNYERGKHKLLLAHSEAMRSLEEVDDYHTWEKEYQERMTRAREEASQVIRSEHDRAIFDMEAQQTIVSGADSVRAQALKREVDDDRAGLADILENNRTAALEAGDSQTRQAFLNNTKEAIRAAEEKGSITAQEAEAMDSKWTQDTAEGLVVMMDPEERAQVLAKPKGTMAEVIPPDRRKVLLRQAQAENKVTRNRAASQNEADRIMAQHAGDRSSALAEARKITDPDVRSMAVDNINQRFNELKAIESEDQAERFERASTMVEAGRLATEIPARDWIKLSMPQRQALEARSRQLRTGEEPIHSDEKYYEWSQLSIEEQAKANLLEWRPYFDDAHYNRAVARQRSILDAKEGGDTTSLTSVRSYDQLIDDQLVASGLFERKPKPGTANAVRWARIESGIAQQIELESEKIGRKLTPLEMREIVDRNILDRYYIDEWGTDPERIGVELTPEDAQNAYVPYDEIPQQSRQRLENLAESYGITADEDRIGKAYAAAKLQLGNERIIAILQGN